ncbi:MAG: STAS domain-containing protein [Lachnospiraceae bacterium]|nr:STAS domain-containing protein [Lachnospiraceae bacterium]
MFNVDRQLQGNKMTVELSGQLDTMAAPQLDEVIRPYFGMVNNIVFDAADLVYVSSSGLRVLLSAQKAMNACGGKMKIINTPSAVRSIFDVTGFSDILTVE